MSEKQDSPKRFEQGRKAEGSAHKKRNLTWELVNQKHGAKIADQVVKAEEEK